VSLSSVEAEYIAATDAACEAVWLRRILADVYQEQHTPTTICCDNMSIIAMTKNPVFHARTKQVEVHYHFIKEISTIRYWVETDQNRGSNCRLVHRRLECQKV